MNNNRKKGNGSILVIVFLIICLGLCVSYIVYDKINFDDVKLNKGDKKDNNDSNIGTRVLSEVEKVGLLSLIKDKYNYLLGQFYPTEDVSKLSTEQLMKMGLNKLRSSYKFSGSYSDSFLEEEFDTYLYKTKVKHGDIKCGCGGRAFIYDEKTHTYSADSTHTKHDIYNEGYVNSEVFFISSSVSDNEVVIDAHVLYERVCGDSCSVQNAYYKTYDDASKKVNPVIGDPLSLIEYHINEYDYNEIKWRIPTTSYKFIISDGNYKLKSVTFK